MGVNAFAPALLAGLAAGLASVALAGLLAGVRRPRRSGSPVPGRSRMMNALAVLGGVGRQGSRARPPLDLEARVVAAGRPGGLGAREVMAAKLAALAAGGGAAAVLWPFAPGRLGLGLVLAGPAVGFLLPDLWLRRRALDRAAQVRRELPALLDLLRVTVDAGLPLAAALEAVGERTSGPLGAEWRVVGREVALGLPLQRALDAMAERLPLEEIRALRAALDRAGRHGAPLAATLAAQARDARLARRRRIQEEAARAGPKIQLVVALLLVPSVLLMVAAALASALLANGSGISLGA